MLLVATEDAQPTAEGRRPANRRGNVDTLVAVFVHGLRESGIPRLLERLGEGGTATCDGRGIIESHVLQSQPPSGPDLLGSRLLDRPAATALPPMPEPVWLGFAEVVRRPAPEMAQTSSAGYRPGVGRFAPAGLSTTYWAGRCGAAAGDAAVDESDGGPFLDSRSAPRGCSATVPDRPEGFQMSRRAKLRQDWDGNLDVLATDYRYDIPNLWAGPHRWKFGFYHIGPHVATSFAEKSPVSTAELLLRHTRGRIFVLPSCVRLYAEMGWALTTTSPSRGTSNSASTAAR